MLKIDFFKVPWLESGRKDVFRKPVMDFSLRMGGQYRGWASHKRQLGFVGNLKTTTKDSIEVRRCTHLPAARVRLVAASIVIKVYVARATLR